MIFKRNGRLSLFLVLVLAAAAQNSQNVSTRTVVVASEELKQYNNSELNSYNSPGQIHDMDDKNFVPLNPIEAKDFDVTSFVTSTTSQTTLNNSTISSRRQAQDESSSIIKRRREREARDVQKFKLEHNLKKDTIVNMLLIEEGNKVTLRDGRVYALDNLKAMKIYTKNAEYILDGKATPLPPVTESRTLIGKVGGDTVVLTKGTLDDISTLDIFGADGSDEYMATVAPGVLGAITPDDLDPESVSKFVIGAFGDMVDGSDEEEEVPPGRYLRANQTHGGTSNRSLQSGACSSFWVMKIAAAFDSTFCAKLGGAKQSREQVERIIARASVLYQQQGICVKLKISHLGGYCKASDDPYRKGINLNNIGCDKYGLLEVFQTYWFENRKGAKRAAAHLFYGQNFPGNTIGCAYMGSLCDKYRGYGVNEMYTTDLQRLGALFAHELGHNIGLYHTWTSGIMGTGNRVWSKKSQERLARLIPKYKCVWNQVN